MHRSCKIMSCLLAVADHIQYLRHVAAGQCIRIPSQSIHYVICRVCMPSAVDEVQPGAVHLQTQTSFRDSCRCLL